MTAKYDISSVLDLTSQQTEPPLRPEKYKMVRGKVARLDMSKITGVTLHQTACVFGVTDEAVRRAGGDPVLAKHKRALGIGAHVTAFNTGRAVYANPMGWYVYHGNGFNTFCFGLEVEGIYAGLRGRPNTVAGDPSKATPLTRATIDAARIGLTFLVERGRALGAPIEYVYAHRQSSSTRRSDPGEEVWDEVVIKYGEPVLGLKVNNDLILPPSNPKNGPGAAIPKEWDSRATARY